MNPPAGQPASPWQNLRQSMRRNPLFSYFFMAYAFSWIVLIPYILSQWYVLPNTPFFDVFFVLNPFAGPALSAYIMTRITEGKAGLLKLRKRLTLLNVGWPWYAFVLLGIPAALMLGIALMPGALASFHGLSLGLGYVFTFVVIFFAGGPLGEEIGWRGFALPRTQARWGALRATLLLGILWTFWHLPHFLTVAQRGGPGASPSIYYINLPIFFVMVMSFTVIMTWVFNHTKGSIFIAILLHASLNTFGTTIVPAFSSQVVSSTDLPFAVGLLILALPIILFTRGRLGY